MLAPGQFIVDTIMDVQTGLNAGTHTIMIKSGDPHKENYNVKPEFVAANLLDAVKQILRRAKMLS